MRPNRFLSTFVLLSIGFGNSGIAGAAGLYQATGVIDFGETVDGQVVDDQGDEWVFTGETGDVVSIEMTGITLNDPFLALLGPGGQELVSDDDSGPGLDALVSGFRLPVSGSYTIVVRGYGGGEGTYSLSLERGEAQGQGEGDLGYGDTVRDRITGSAGDEWTFSGQAGDAVTIAMRGDSLDDPYLDLLDPGGERLASDDDGGDGLDALIAEFVLPRAGTYTIVAQGYGGGLGTYSLTLTTIDQSDIGGHEGSLAYGQSAEDRITTAAGDEWTFRGEAGDVVTILMSGDTLGDSFLELIGPDGGRLISDDDGGPDLDALIGGYRLPAAGEYTIVARGYGEDTGAYTISLEAGAVNVESEGFLGFGDLIEDVVVNSAGDEWYFTGDSGEVVSIAMTGISLDDTFLELYGPDGDRLAYDDDGGPDLNSMIAGFSLPVTGTFTIVARGYGGNTGSYNLLLQRGVERELPDLEGPLVYGSVVNGRVTDADGEEWIFTGKAGDAVTIELDGNTLSDPYLLLLGPSGVVVISDDDSGPGLNSMIGDHVLTSDGRYTIVARGFGGGTGTYTLALSGSVGSESVQAGVPPFVSINHPACAPGATYFVLNLDGAGIPNHDFFRVTFEALGDGASVEHFFPTIGFELVGQVEQRAVIDVAGDSLDLTGLSTAAELREALDELLNRQRDVDLSGFSVNIFETAAQPPLEFVVFATHPEDGGVGGLLEWQLNEEEAPGDHRLFIDCG